MGKVNRAYPHLIGGVSQQAPEKRGPGEHWEQTNMVSDPVHGLIRRPGSLWCDEQTEAGPDFPAGALDVATLTRGYDFQVGPEKFMLSAGIGAGATSVPPLVVVNKTAQAIVPLNRPVTDTVLDDLIADGVAAVHSVGQFLFIAGKGITPTYTTTERWAPEENQKRHVVWIRGGAYSRKFRFCLVRGQQKFWVEYHTKAAAYPEVLDTSGLDPTAADYLKQVNDLTNEYNSRATAWIGDSLADTQPENIATNLATELTNSGFLSPTGTVSVMGSTICITDPSVEDVESDDNGDQNLMRAVGNLVGAPELLTTIAYPGKVVKIRPRADTEGDVFYLEAVAKDGSTGPFTAVTWEECAGTEFQPNTAFVFLGVLGGEAYVTSDPQQMRDWGFTEFPDYMPNVAGDADSNPPPKFLEQPITMLTMFQDRLIVGSGNSSASSRTSDYLNFFRASIVTVAQDDPVRFVTIGGEDDVLEHALTYDRNLVFWGQQQYLVDGRKPFTPGTASAVIMAKIPGAAEAPPILGDQFMFYARRRKDVTTVHHLQPGKIVENPEAFELSRKLTSYINGYPVEIKVGNNPDHVFVRTTANDAIYVYAYQDAGNGERVLSAWHKWTFHASLGNMLAMSVEDDNLFVLFQRQLGAEEDGTSTIALDRIPLTPVVDHPYLDSVVLEGTPEKLTTPGAPTLYFEANGRDGEWAGRNPATSATALTGTVWEGTYMEGCITLTSPYVTDRDGAALQEGRLTVNTVGIQFSDTGGFRYSIHANGDPDCSGGVIPGYTPEAAPVGALNMTSALLAQSSTNQSATQDTFRAGLSINVGELGNPLYESVTGVDHDFLVTTNGEPDYTGRVTGEVSFKVELFTEADSYDTYGGLLVLEDNGPACLTNTPTRREYSYGSLMSDTTPDPMVALARTRVGVRVMARAQGTNIRVQAEGYAQRVNGAGNSVEAIPGYTAGYTSHFSSVLIPVPVAALTGASARLEFVFDTATSALTIYGLTAAGVRGDEVYPALADAGDVASITAILEEYNTPDTPVAGTILIPSVGSGFDLMSVGDVAEEEPAPAYVPVVGPTSPVYGNCSPNCGRDFTNGVLTLADQIDFDPETVVDVSNTGAYERSTFRVPIGRETREYRLTLGTYLWTPMNPTTVEWNGQFFNRTRRL
jgi:hypothetical protein